MYLQQDNFLNTTSIDIKSSLDGLMIFYSKVRKKIVDI